LRPTLPGDWAATLVAVDGNVVVDVPRQLERLPPDATHLTISAGGNDALGCASILGQPAGSVAEVVRELADIQDTFRREFREMLDAVLRKNLPTLVCTIYDAIPDLPREALAALSFFNDVITREACRAAVPVLDLRVLCRDRADYSSLSPIEPSALGGAKIAAALAHFITTHDFSRRECVLFC
ncbi:MAG TPA: SGNH/GDSL hydrolase family protein, partial [Pirellulaceae bacterium]|nr:SGNH/GDSL hydrolase family protein [Pirellulaceae bacterium]